MYESMYYDSIDNKKSTTGDVSGDFDTVGFTIFGTMDKIISKTMI